MKPAPSVSARANGGIALLEVLLASFIMVTGVLAVLSMQTLAVGTAQSNSHLLRAEWLLNDILERMKANPAGFAVALVTMPQGRVTAQCETRSGCSSAELAAHDLALWRHRLATLLPAGRGEIARIAMADFPAIDRVYHVQVRWRGNSDNQSAAPAPVSSGIVVL